MSELSLGISLARRILFGFAGVALFTSCQSSNTCPALDPGTSPQAEIILAGADDVGNKSTLATGSQGGYHIFIEGRTEGLCPDLVEVDLQLRVLETGEIIIATPYPKMLEADDNSSWSSLGKAIPFQLCPTVGIDILDRDLELSMIVRDQEGREATSSRTVQVQCPTGHKGIETTCKFLCNSASAE